MSWNTTQFCVHLLSHVEYSMTSINIPNHLIQVGLRWKCPLLEQTGMDLFTKLPILNGFKGHPHILFTCRDIPHIQHLVSQFLCTHSGWNLQTGRWQNKHTLSKAEVGWLHSGLVPPCGHNVKWQLLPTKQMRGNVFMAFQHETVS